MKHGRTASGSQRWRCASCALTSTAPRRDAARRAQLREFLGWLLSGKAQWETGGTGGRAFRKRTGWCWRLRPAIAPDGRKRHVVMADGTYVAHGWCLLVAIDGATGETIAWQWCDRESTAAYMALFSRIPAPDALVTDGMRGILSACAQSWPGTRVQRCLVHVQRDTKADLTSRPRLQAGRELKKLSDALTRVDTPQEAARWGEGLNAWYVRWKDFIDERTMAADAPGDPRALKRQWWWTHGEVRRCYHRLERLFRDGSLFAWLDPALDAAGPVPRTTNLLEGGADSPVKRTLAQHHGLPEEHMRRACEWRCYMKSAHPDPHVPHRAGERGTRGGGGTGRGHRSLGQRDPAAQP